MNALLICPADRPAVGELAARCPLATTPLLGRSLLEYWIEALAARGVKHVTVLASDRPTRVRAHVGDGRRWGIQLDVLPTAHELTAEEARRKFLRGGEGEVIVLDHLPDQPGLPLFDSYAGWFAAVRAWLPHAVTPGRIGVRQVMPGVWIGLRAEVDPTARLIAPCWIGDYARIGPRAVVGPGAVVDDRSVVEEGARVVESLVGPDTYVGRFVSVEQSLALGRLLIHAGLNSSVHVPDPFLLADLTERPVRGQRTPWPGRIAAGLAMLTTSPFAVGVIALSLVRGVSPWHLRLALRCQRGARHGAQETFAYYELTGARTWLRRWPQFWSVLRGDMTWVGNRPLRPSQALNLVSDFERLWLDAPVGLISLADAHGCPDGMSDEAMAHASFYAVHANRRLDAFIFSRCLLAAAMVWPIRGYRRRKEAAVPLQDLVPKQEL
jgi:hypothetical protein